MPHPHDPFTEFGGRGVRQMSLTNIVKHTHTPTKESEVTRNTVETNSYVVETETDEQPTPKPTVQIQTPIEEKLEEPVARRTRSRTPPSRETQDARRARSKSPDRPAAHLRGGIRVVEAQPAITRPRGKLETYLRISVTVVDNAGRRVNANALIDTGAEVNIVREGLLHASNFQPARRPLKLITASNHRLPGGMHEATVNLVFQGADTSSKEKVRVTAPTVLYEAQVGEDMILSYQWLGERGIEINPRMHGMWATVGQRRVWLAGSRTTPLSKKTR